MSLIAAAGIAAKGAAQRAVDPEGGGALLETIPRVLARYLLEPRVAVQVLRPASLLPRASRRESFGARTPRTEKEEMEREEEEEAEEDAGEGEDAENGEQGKGGEEGERCWEPDQ